jgi:hypothetical protein
MKGARPVGWFAAVLQALGAVGLAVGLFVVLPWGIALAIVSTLALAGGTVLEIGKRPRAVLGPAATTPEQRRVHSLADRAANASGR